MKENLVEDGRADECWWRRNREKAEEEAEKKKAEGKERAA